MKSNIPTGIARAFACAAAFAAIAPAQAQQSEIQQLREQMKLLQERLDKLEAETKKSSDATRTTPPVTSKLPITVSGLLQVQSLNYFDQKGSGTISSDTFRLRRGEIRITAPRITDRISGSIQIDPAKATNRTRIAIPAQVINVPPGGGPVTIPAQTINADSRARDTLLQEIQLSYLLNKKGKASNYIDAGQYKIPIGLESLQSSGALQLIERALIFSQRDPFDSGYGDVRDTGVQLRGTTGTIDYRVGVFNGFGDRQNTTAILDNKAVMALLSYHPSDNLQLGLSGGIGDIGTGAGQPRANHNLFNLFGSYKRRALTLQSEFLRGDVHLQNGAVTRDVSGYYASVAYMLSKKVEGVFRYDFLDSNKTMSDADVRDLILGFNYYIKGNNAKIQTNLVKRAGGANAPADLQNDRLELRTALQVGF